MARQDILIGTDYGELQTVDNPVGRTVYDFMLLGRMEGLDNERYAYGQIAVPERFGERFAQVESLHVRIPYTAVYRELKVRFRVTTSVGGEHCLINPADNTVWFTVRDRTGGPIRLSEFGTADAEGLFRLVRCGGGLHLYQHPTTGVGLVDFLHGNFENTGLAARLQSEFENDRMTINDAFMNSETGELLLDVTEKDG